MSYHQFITEDGEEYGSFEVFYNDGALETESTQFKADEPLEKLPHGWYWWACFPGCLPDSDAVGPFDTEREAIDDAQRC